MLQRSLKIREKQYIYSDVSGLMDICFYPFDDRQDVAVHSQRSKRQYHTLPAMKHSNTERSKRHFERYVMNNFGMNDYFVTFTFKASYSDEEIENRFENYRRRLGRKCKKSLIEFKWIFVNERGIENNRLHIHCLINKEVEYNRILECWDNKDGGNPEIMRIYSRHSDMDILCLYLEKCFDNRLPYEQNYHSSRNLVAPLERIDTDVNDIEISRLVHYSLDQKKKYLEQRYMGYKCLQCNVFENPVTGYPIISIKMIMNDKEKLANLGYIPFEKEHDTIAAEIKPVLYYTDNSSVTPRYNDFMESILAGAFVPEDDYDEWFDFGEEMIYNAEYYY